MEPDTCQITAALTTTGDELARILIPGRADRQAPATDGPDTWWPTPEPPHRINQIYLEPILFAHAEAMAGCTILNRTRVVGFTQSETSVLAQAEALDGGEIIEIRCDYLVGCEGGRSETRRVIGAKLHGDAEIGRVQSTFIRAPSLLGSPAVAGEDCSTQRGGALATCTRSMAVRHGSSQNYLRLDEHDSRCGRPRCQACARFRCVGADLELRSHFQRGLDRAPTGRRPFPADRRGGLHLQGTRYIRGCRWPATA